MDRKRPLVSYLILGSATALVGWAALTLPHRSTVTTVPPRPPIERPQPAAARPQVDVVFVLDTTGSMSALLDGAKKKIWEIARYIAQGQPAPDLRIGLVAYRDVGDDYVTKFFDLTDDLDGVYQNLAAFAAGGGGDTPEHVAKALHEAVYKASWSNNKNAVKMIYLVGDAPPHTDYNDGFDYRGIANTAKERNIQINTVRCGSDEDTRVAWTEIASRAGGEFSSIEQSGGMVMATTPFDADLARLNRALTETAIPYGTVEKRRSVREKAELNLAAPAAVQAERAGLFGSLSTRGRAAAVSDGDLLEDVANKKVALDKVEAGALPEAMQGLSAGERESYVEGKKKARAEILNQINAMTAKRDAYLRAAPAKGSSDGFDEKVRSGLKKKAAKVGILY